MALKNFPIDSIFCSGLQRASHTADAVHAHHSSKPRITVPKFMEMNFGSLEGQALVENSDALRYWKEFTERVEKNGELDFKMGEHGESQNEVYQRGIEGLIEDDLSIFKRSIANKHKYVVAAAHGRFNKVKNLFRNLWLNYCFY